MYVTLNCTPVVRDTWQSQLSHNPLEIALLEIRILDKEILFQVSLYNVQYIEMTISAADYHLIFFFLECCWQKLKTYVLFCLVQSNCFVNKNFVTFLKQTGVPHVMYKLDYYNYCKQNCNWSQNLSCKVCS